MFNWALEPTVASKQASACFERTNLVYICVETGEQQESIDTSNFSDSIPCAFDNGDLEILVNTVRY